MSTEERQKEILDVALNIIHKDGYKNLTVRNIANRIDISEPAVYRHFDNKEDIVRSLAEMMFNENSPDIDQEMYEDPHSLLKEILNSQFEELEEDPNVTAVLFHGELFREFPEVERLFVKHRQKKKEFLKKVVREGQERGYFSNDVNPEIFALIFMGSVRMSALEWRGEGFSYSLTGKTDQIANELFKILERGD